MPDKDEERVMSDNEYIDLSKKDLDSFPPYSGTFRERLDEYTKYYSQQPEHREGQEPENPIYNFIRGNGYIPSIDDAQKWSLGVIKNKESIENCSVYQLTPDSEEWFSVLMGDCFDCITRNLKILEEQFIGGFDIKQYVQYISHRDETNYENDDEPYFKDMDDVLGDIRLEYSNTVERAFTIGFLYHDAWWKARHEEAARRYYEIRDKNRKNGQKGGSADKRKKQNEVLYKLVFELRSRNELSNRENTAISQIMKLACEYDDAMGDGLFQRSEKPLSKKWFVNWYDDFLTSLEINKYK